MIDRIEPLPFLIALTILVALWLVLGIRFVRRERERADQIVVEYLVARHHTYIDRGRCGAVWFEDQLHWCDRPNDHTGPHLDSPTGELRREDESFIGGPGIRLHTVRP